MKILLVDDNSVGARDLAATLQRDPALTITRIASGAPTHGTAAAHRPDVVLVSLACPDRGALERIRQIEPRPVVLLAEADDPAFMEEAIRAGVLSYFVTGAAPLDLRPTLRAAIALFRQQEQQREALRRSERRIEERSIIDRAKAVLIRDRRVSEAEAHRWLQRQAMRRRVRMVEVARSLMGEQTDRGR